MRVIPKDKVIFSFNAEHPCQYTVQDGETFWVETDDCYSGQITDASVKRPDIDISIMDCSVGPIAVQGAQPGDTLCVEILAIEFGPQGVMVTSKGLGVLGDRITEPDTKVIPIRDGFAHFSDTIRLPLTPMVGVCGVAPKPGLDVHCAVPGDHGSNLDTKMIKVGSRVYLPVAVPGAGLAVGDLHACMGDGELSGTGIETPAGSASRRRYTGTGLWSALSLKRRMPCTSWPPRRLWRSRSAWRYPIRRPFWRRSWGWIFRTPTACSAPPVTSRSARW